MGGIGETDAPWRSESNFSFSTNKRSISNEIHNESCQAWRATLPSGHLHVHLHFTSPCEPDSQEQRRTRELVVLVVLGQGQEVARCDAPAIPLISASACHVPIARASCILRATFVNGPKQSSGQRRSVALLKAYTCGAAVDCSPRHHNPALRHLHGIIVSLMVWNRRMISRPTSHTSARTAKLQGEAREPFASAQTHIPAILCSLARSWPRPKRTFGQPHIGPSFIQAHSPITTLADEIAQKAGAAGRAGAWRCSQHVKARFGHAGLPGWLFVRSYVSRRFGRRLLPHRDHTRV